MENDSRILGPFSKQKKDERDFEIICTAPIAHVRAKKHMILGKPQVLDNLAVDDKSINYSILSGQPKAKKNDIAFMYVF
ncbi:hypothetical protein CEXT_469951 [Caerostris extrusa]|uniref:Uncharacterized protein n=1 Tax=Caerostris extrusa TaxID=172846 RepID=A0AAV4XWS6_CAEEX|nr:hypothetical protein CEXT_469951 [Caerostris extrusa]